MTLQGLGPLTVTERSTPSSVMPAALTVAPMPMLASSWNGSKRKRTSKPAHAAIVNGPASMKKSKWAPTWNEFEVSAR
jgi:hypothetical protein